MMKKKCGDIMDCAGTLKMTDKEAEEIMTKIKKGWSSWKPKPF